jgi:hypothetical protein
MLLHSAPKEHLPRDPYIRRETGAMRRKVGNIIFQALSVREICVERRLQLQ